MLHEYLSKANVGNQEFFYGLNSIYELRDMPLETTADKMKFIILLHKFVIGLNPSINTSDFDQPHNLIPAQVNQLFSDAISYFQKRNLIGNILTKLYKIIHQDLSIEFSKIGYNNQLISMIQNPETDWGVFFKKGYETGAGEEEQNSRKVLGTKEEDWIGKSFHILLPDGTSLKLQSNSDCKKIKQNQFKDIFYSDFIRELMTRDHIKILSLSDKIDGKKVRFFYLQLLFSILFSQDPSEYSLLSFDAKNEDNTGSTTSDEDSAL